MSDLKSDKYFADGITEDVVNGRAVWRWLPVIGRYTSGQSGDTNKRVALFREHMLREIRQASALFEGAALTPK